MPGSVLTRCATSSQNVLRDGRSVEIRLRERHRRATSTSARIEAGIVVEHAHQALDHQAGGDEHDERQRHFGGDERGSGSRSCAPSSRDHRPTSGRRQRIPASGARPKSTPVRTLTSAVNPSTRASRLMPPRGIAKRSEDDARRQHALKQASPEPGDEETSRSSNHRNHEPFSEELCRHAPA